MLWRRSKIEDGGPAEWGPIERHLIAQPIQAMVFSSFERRKKNRDAERWVRCDTVDGSMVKRVFLSVAAARANFCGETLMACFVERQLVIRPPRKNHKPEGQAKHAVKG